MSKRTRTLAKLAGLTLPAVVLVAAALCGVATPAVVCSMLAVQAAVLSL